MSLCAEEPRAGAPGRAIAVVAPVPRLLLTKDEAAVALGMSTDSFERYVMAHLRAVRKGRLRLFPVTELERWIEENALRGPADG